MRLSISGLQAQVSGITENLVTICQEADAVLASVEALVNADGLEGNQYRNAKSYFQNNYQPLVRGIVLMCRSGLEANMNCLSYLGIIEDGGLQIDTDLLVNQIDGIRNCIANLEAIDSVAVIASNQFLIYSMRNNIRRLENIITQVYEFDSASSGLYDDMMDCADSIKLGVEELSNNSAGDDFRYQSVVSQWARELTNAWAQYELKIKNIDFQSLNSDYWNRTDGYFDGHWWQDEGKLREAIGLIALEISLLGGINLLDLDKGYKNDEYNPRMLAIQALSNTERTGKYDMNLVNGLEVHFMLNGKDYAEANSILKTGDIKYIGERYNEKVLKKSGNALENGWGDIILGLMTIGGALIVKKLSSSGTQIKGNEGTGVGKTVRAKDVKYKQSSIDKAFSKHSKDFGSYPNGGKTSVSQFQKDISNFINNPNNIQKPGSWWGTKGTHIYNPNTGQWVFINADGTFNTAFKLSAEQLKHLKTTGVVK